jgi:hypothetical protein
MGWLDAVHLLNVADAGMDDHGFVSSATENYGLNGLERIAEGKGEGEARSVRGPLKTASGCSKRCCESRQPRGACRQQRRLQRLVQSRECEQADGDEDRSEDGCPCHSRRGKSASQLLHRRPGKRAENRKRKAGSDAKYPHQQGDATVLLQ